MMQASIYGRVGQDPRSIETKSGKPMTVSSLAVQIGESDEGPLWVGLTAFGNQAEALLRHQKGDMLSASGRVQRNSWTGKDGAKREQLQLVVDSLVSSRTVRPTGGGRRSDPPQQDRNGHADSRRLDDDIPF